MDNQDKEIGNEFIGIRFIESDDDSLLNNETNNEIKVLEIGPNDKVIFETKTIGAFRAFQKYQDVYLNVLMKIIHDGDSRIAVLPPDIRIGAVIRKVE